MLLTPPTIAEGLCLTDRQLEAVSAFPDPCVTSPRGSDGPDMLGLLGVGDKVQERQMVCRGPGLALPQAGERNTPPLLLASDQKGGGGGTGCSSLNSGLAKPTNMHLFAIFKTDNIATNVSKRCRQKK